MHRQAALCKLLPTAGSSFPDGRGNRAPRFPVSVSPSSASSFRRPVHRVLIGADAPPVTAEDSIGRTNRKLAVSLPASFRQLAPQTGRQGGVSACCRASCQRVLSRIGLGGPVGLAGSGWSRCPAGWLAVVWSVWLPLPFCVLFSPFSLFFLLFLSFCVQIVVCAGGWSPGSGLRGVSRVFPASAFLCWSFVRRLLPRAGVPWCRSWWSARLRSVVACAGRLRLGVRVPSLAGPCFLALLLRCCGRGWLRRAWPGCCVRVRVGLVGRRVAGRAPLPWGVRRGLGRLGAGRRAAVASARAAVARRARRRLVPLALVGRFPGRPLGVALSPWGCPVSQLSLFPSLSPSVPPVWAFGGARSLSPSASALASSVALAVLRSGAGLSVGCCVGADSVVLAAAVSAGLAPRLSVFSAFGPLGSGSPAGVCSLSAVAQVRRAVLSGASLRSWAGGGPSVPLSVRLAARTGAVGAAASSGAVVFLSASSRGSLSLARSVAARGLPVVAFPSSPGASLPLLSPRGRWLPLASAPASLSLFHSFPGFFWE
ncbi:hypothetical protein Alvin_3194 (plasmid) [Allochromatium vinosum DSM 180]|uniref:Uncharacterized protein n=1 Tax=Allochromatium vinosum (strain ATCC 17899 / DSM 180 / NBRC 103801 / NCIMB 10441 / D) TaxID=572477 RepID=D3RW79_ALLVD|nr:hypothetical protein Alvin_3194 [Allochromatium vinosum DSM 180]